MTTRVELVMLQKTMVVVEGVARKLDPQLNMWSTAEPVVGSWIAENLGPRGVLDDLEPGVGVGRRTPAARAGAAQTTSRAGSLRESGRRSPRGTIPRRRPDRSSARFSNF